MTSRAMLFTGAGQPLRAVSQKLAPLIGAEIRVRVLYCTLCRSDLATYRGSRIEATPTVLGHEVVGAIESFGPDAKKCDFTGVPAAIGDRVTWAIVASCGDCFPCRHGFEQKCERGTKYGHHRADPERPDGGGLAERMTLVAGTSWFRVPDSLSTPVASLANCAAATADAVVEAAGSIEGRSILVFGAGLLGLFASAMLSERGAARIVAIDPDRDARERALTFGATHALDPHELDPPLETIVGPRGADVALELAGRSETVEACLARVRIGGVVILAGTVSPTPAVPLDPQQFVRRMLTLRGVHNYQPRHLWWALDFLARLSGKYPMESLVAETFPLDRAEEAFAAASRHPGRRVAVVP